MNAEAKRKNKCSVCNLTEHNAARCLEKMQLEGGRSNGVGG